MTNIATDFNYISTFIHKEVIQNVSHLATIVKKYEHQSIGCSQTISYLSSAFFDINTQLRAISNLLSPPELIEFGLGVVAEKYLEDFRSSHPHLIVKLGSTNDCQLNAEQKTMIFMLIQSVLTVLKDLNSLSINIENNKVLISSELPLKDGELLSILAVKCKSIVREASIEQVSPFTLSIVI